MTEWTDIPDANLEPTKPVRSVDAIALRDNPIAIAEGAAGAPRVQTAGIANGAVTHAKMAGSSVGQSQLRTTTGDVSTSSSSGEDLTLPGGEYGFYPRTRRAGGAGGNPVRIAAGISWDAFRTTINLVSSNGVDTMFARQRYIQASPPYDLGDGQIPLFVFLRVSSGSGRVVAAYAAPEAPWHYNGPTDIRAAFYRAGKPYRRCKPTALRAPPKGPREMEKYLDCLCSEPEEDIEITQAMKNADMAAIPHPFGSIEAGGDAVVLLDPVSPMMERLAALHHAGAPEDALSLIHGGYIEFGNDPLPRHGPAGVIVAAARWRLGAGGRK